MTQEQFPQIITINGKRYWVFEFMGEKHQYEVIDDEATVKRYQELLDKINEMRRQIYNMLHDLEMNHWLKILYNLELREEYQDIEYRFGELNFEFDNYLYNPFVYIDNTGCDPYTKECEFDGKIYAVLVDKLDKAEQLKEFHEKYKQLLERAKKLYSSVTSQ